MGVGPRAQPCYVRTAGRYLAAEGKKEAAPPDGLQCKRRKRFMERGQRSLVVLMRLGYNQVGWPINISPAASLTIKFLRQDKFRVLGIDESLGNSLKLASG